MPPFVHLVNGEDYLPGLWDLRFDGAARAAWAARLRESMERIQAGVAASERPEDVPRVEAAAAEWNALLSRLDEPAVHLNFPTVHDLTVERERLLRTHGVPDAFGSIKHVENVRSLSRYPDAVAAVEAARSRAHGDPLAALDEAVRGMLAGNVFDLNSPLVADEWGAGRLDFDRITRELPRPAVDHRQAFAEAWHAMQSGSEARKALIFVDNAGMDFVLGCVPLARALVQSGWQVTLAANELPALNDITAAEATGVLARISSRDPVVRTASRSRRLTVISTGNAAPGIDLRRVPAPLNDEAESAGLIIFEGQGRGIESTGRAVIARPTLRIAMVKSPIVAEHLGLRVLDTVVDFRPAGAPAPWAGAPCG
jgi:type II pantothenate kinase